MTTPLLLALLTALTAAPPDDLAEAALRAVSAKVPHFQPVTLPARGELALRLDQSVTAADLAGVTLDADPPVCRPPATPYDPRMADGLPAGTQPYCSPNLAPFRLRQFTAELSYTGWHNFNLMEYGLTHGFGVLAPYVMKERGHLPAGTRFLKWGDFVNWDKLLAARGIAPGRWDQLAEVDVTKLVLDHCPVWPAEPDSIAMIDLEHGAPLSPEQLAKQPWYPKAASAVEREAFEGRYYRGYLLTYTGPIAALRAKGWTSVGIYPQPYGSGWYDLLGRYEKHLGGLPDAGTYWPWVRYGRDFVAAQDVLYPDTYVYYWSPQNVAYTVARLDFDRALLATLPQPKPVRPYFWTLLHGGDASYHWWANQPIPTEDARAMFTFAFFCGVDGAVLWNWSDVGNHNAPAPLWAAGRGGDVMLKDDFTGGEPRTAFHRYDVFAVTEVKGEQVSGQRIQPFATPFGPRVDAKKPTLTISAAELRAHARCAAEPVRGVVEALALVKLFEPLLRAGAPCVDVPAIEQYVHTLPIVRRVKLGGVSLLATYDPQVVWGKPARSVTLTDFDGRAGRTLTLPADGQVRVFAVRE